MRTTSGVGRVSALLIAAGVAAAGLTGCASGTGTGNTTAQDAGTGVSTTTSGDAATSTATTTTNPTPTPTSEPSTSAAPTTKATTTAPTTTSTTAKPTTPTTKPTTKPAPTASHPGGVWANVPLGSNTPGQLDPRCLTGRVMCVDMKTRTLVWVIDGVPQYGMDVRFGDENNPTRKGQFQVDSKQKDCISSIYHTPMPDAMFFSWGEAVHFSIDFKTYGYAHHSHGCINVRDRAMLDKLFSEARVGDKVVVYAG